MTDQTTACDTGTTRVMDRAHELEAHGDNGCAADARLMRALVGERDALRVALADLHSWMRMWSELSRKVGREAEQAADAIAAAGRVLAGLNPDAEDDDAE